MKKLFSVLLLLALCAGCGFAEGEKKDKFVEGILAHANISAEEYKDFAYEAFSHDVWNVYSNINPAYSIYANKVPGPYVAFDSVTDMLMALDAGKIEIMELPEHVGRYLLSQNGNAEKYIPYAYENGVNYYMSMGFNEGNKWFEPFNAAIKAMNEDDTLLLMKAKHIAGTKSAFKPITFEKFPDAETVRIAVTGDMPPVDYIAADGTPAGFSTAMLAEIGRRLKVNIELLNVTAGARAAALASGRADGVFWFWFDKTTKTYRDVPAGVVLTEPYYMYDTYMYIGKR